MAPMDALRRKRTVFKIKNLTLEYNKNLDVTNGSAIYPKINPDPRTFPKNSTDHDQKVFKSHYLGIPLHLKAKI